MAKSQDPLLLTVKEVTQLLRVHRPKVYDLLRDGTIEGFKLGADWRIKRESIERLVGPIPPGFFGRNGNSASAP
jgi:excisionase family DNA binding protein